MKKTKVLTCNNKGYISFAELLVVIAIMSIVAVMVMKITVGTVRAVMINSQETVSEVSARSVLNRIAEDVRLASTNSTGGSAGAFWDQSDETRIYITRGKNLDAFSVPNNGDIELDIACYEYQPPSPNENARGDANYKGGRIIAGATSGASAGICGANQMAQFSDPGLDVTAFKISYCRPDQGVPGTYTCSATLEEPGDIDNDSTCVWMVRLSIITRRTAYMGYNDPHATTSFNTAVRPRMVYLTSLLSDEDGDGKVDCCDGDETTRGDINWCPLPTKH